MCNSLPLIKADEKKRRVLQHDAIKAAVAKEPQQAALGDVVLQR